ncbi:hypothetical protein ABZ914_20000 [Spirillospora sp. NPDC046719]
MHGCQGAFEVADGEDEAVYEYVAKREQDWLARPSGLNRKQAAIGCARADVVHWMHRDRWLLNCAKTAEEAAFEDAAQLPGRGMVLRGLTDQLGSPRMRQFQRWAGETHFWCELLAQMAQAISRYEELKGRMIPTVERILASREAPELTDGLRRTGVIGVAVNSTWRYLLENIHTASGIENSLMTLLNCGQVDSLIWPIRVIAVLMCPDASRHPTVRRYCWDPIIRHGAAKVRDEVQERLAQVFPDDPWFAQPGKLPGHRHGH